MWYSHTPNINDSSRISITNYYNRWEPKNSEHASTLCKERSDSSAGYGCSLRLIDWTAKIAPARALASRVVNLFFLYSFQHAPAAALHVCESRRSRDAAQDVGPTDRQYYQEWPFQGTWKHSVLSAVKRGGTYKLELADDAGSVGSVTNVAEVIEAGLIGKRREDTCRKRRLLSAVVTLRVGRGTAMRGTRYNDVHRCGHSVEAW